MPAVTQSNRALAVAATHSWFNINFFVSLDAAIHKVMNPNPLLSTLLTLVLPCNDLGTELVALPAKITALTEAQGEYVEITLRVLAGRQFDLPLLHGPCALQFFTPSTVSERPKATSAVFAARALNMTINRVDSGWWTVKLAVLTKERDPSEFTKLFMQGIENGEYSNVDYSREVIKDVHNLYGEVVGQVYGAKHCDGTLRTEVVAWMEERRNVLGVCGFYDPQRVCTDSAALARLSPIALGAMDDACNLVHLMETFGYETVLNRLEERYEEAEIHREVTRQRELEESFARSMQRKRVITLGGFSGGK